MAQDTLQQILKRATKDKAFRALLIQTPDEALKEYKDKLTVEEITALKTLEVDVLDGMVAVVESEKKQFPWRPGSFKEFGGAVLSILLIILILWSARIVFQQIGSQPTVYEVGSNTNVYKEVDAFQQAKDIFNILFPIVSALTTYWLGTAVGSQQAAKSEQVAEEAREGERAAVEKSFKLRQDASQALGAFKASRKFGPQDTRTQQSNDEIIRLLEKAANL